MMRVADISQYVSSEKFLLCPSCRKGEMIDADEGVSSLYGKTSRL